MLTENIWCKAWAPHLQTPDIYLNGAQYTLAAEQHKPRLEHLSYKHHMEGTPRFEEHIINKGEATTFPLFTATDFGA